MYQMVIVRHLHGRGIFVTESRNEPNTALTPTPGGAPEERPVILGRKLAAKERRTLLETRNRLKEAFKGTECHITPTPKGGEGISGPCMRCPVCYTHGGLRSGEKAGNYGRAGIVLYDDAFNLGDSEIEMLTMNSVDTKTQRTGTALATETFVYGGTFVNVVTVKSDLPDILNLVIDSIRRTGNYGARSRFYGRVVNQIRLIVKTSRPLFTSYGVASLTASPEDLERVIEDERKSALTQGAEIVQEPTLGTPDEVLMSADRNPDVQSWYREVEGYIGKKRAE